MASQTTVFDDLDDATAELIIKLQLDDIASSNSQQATTESNSDDQIAHQLYEAELRSYNSLRGFPEHIPEHMRIPLFECAACSHSNDAEHDYVCPCNHHYCEGCVTKLFDRAMQDESLYPPRCCGQEIPFDQARIYLPDELAKSFDANKEELDDKRRAYCHFPTCSTYIPVSKRDGDVASCPSCDRTTCTICKAASHAGDCPQDEGVQSLLEEAAREGWQRCHACGRMVELTIGCNHMTCPCSAQFCYRCGRTWKTCDCPQFDEDRLYERAHAVAQREGGNAAVVADQLRENHQCDEHNYRRVNGRNQCDGCGQLLTQYIYRCTVCHTDTCHRCRYNRWRA